MLRNAGGRTAPNGPLSVILRDRSMRCFELHTSSPQDAGKYILKRARYAESAFWRSGVADMLWFVVFHVVRWFDFESWPERAPHWMKDADSSAIPLSWHVQTPCITLRHAHHRLLNRIQHHLHLARMQWGAKLDPHPQPQISLLRISVCNQVWSGNSY